MKENTKKRLQIDLKKYCNSRRLIRSSRKTAPIPTKLMNLNSLLEKTKIQNPSFNQIYDSEDTQSELNKTMKKALNIYEFNLEFYETNQLKLEAVIASELKNRNYLQGKKILEFFRKRGAITFKRNNNIQIFVQELKVFNEFLLENYQKKKMKEITITCEKIKEQQRIINQKTNQFEYDDIYGMLELKTSKSRNYDFISQYQHICNSFSIQDRNIKPYLNIKNHLESHKENILTIFEKSKNDAKFIIKQRTRKFHEDY